MKETVDVNTSGVIPVPDGAPKYDIRALCDYCKEHGKKADALTEEELKQFIVGTY